MKSIQYREFADLTPNEQAGAIEVCLQEYLLIASREPRYFDLWDAPLSDRISKAIALAYEYEDEESINEYIMDECGDELRELAKLQAEEYLYESDDQLETVVSYIELRKGMGK
jgi:hypothetical protein